MQRLGNAVSPTPASIAAGKKIYDASCTACHGDKGQGAGSWTTISIIEEKWRQTAIGLH